ncbi:MAG TPA: tol-pal system protein YbgF [Kofleriaceae bacterium]|jgi:tol-pal system protein YbgF|nr:tol-pal system protein YbgF [Kofleriaceae bacterium]
MSALREDNRRLSQTVSALRSDRRAQDRKIADLQHQLDALRAKVVTGAIDSSVPVLPVEVAGPAVSLAPAAPGAARVVGVTDDGTEIVYEGDAAIGRPAALPPASDDDAPALHRTPPASPRTAAASQPLGEVPVPSVPATADRIEVMRRIPPISARVATRTKTREHEAPGDRSADAANEYRAAVELVKAVRYAEALVALRAFIAKYPHHDYADNAQYWVGEALYAQKDYARALTEFRAVIEVYPRGNKVPDALLKMGYCYQAIGQGEKARAVLEQVVNLYPKSEPAMLAGKRLEPR